MGEKATGRPTQPIPLLPRLGLFALLLLAFLEGVWRLAARHQVPPAAAPVVQRLWPAVGLYGEVRTWVVEHPWLATALAIFGLVSFLLLYRWWLLTWHNEIAARITGSYFSRDAEGFPSTQFDLVAAIKNRPPGTTFVGLSPVQRSWRPTRWEPVYVSARQRTMHTHVLGKTGSGKTASVIWPHVLQDALDGKGILVIDAKGSDENIRSMKALAAAANRIEQLRIFSLPAWNQPQLFSHSYNMLYVRPRSPGNQGGDPIATAERVFSIMPLGDNEYYNTQAQVMFTNLCRVLHGMVDGAGNGMPFTMHDVAVCLKGLSAPAASAWRLALMHCLDSTLDQEAAREVKSQESRLGNDVQKSLSGIIGAVDKFLSPLVNAYDPDLVFEDILEKNGIVYVQLPANLFKIQAPAMGKVMLMDVQQEGSLRQVFRTQRNQTPFAVHVDEFYNFADESIVDSLNKLRDANLEYLLAHQSIADLEMVSKEFSTAVWDNTRTKHILNQDNPELCEKVAKSIGTHQVVEKTVRKQEGALLTSLTTGDMSSKLVETFRLHPNAIKTLARCGQGYLVNDEGLKPIVYGMLPPLQADLPLPKKDQTKARGLRLYETFIGTQGSAPPVEAAS